MVAALKNIHYRSPTRVNRPSYLRTSKRGMDLHMHRVASRFSAPPQLLLTHQLLLAVHSRPLHSQKCTQIELQEPQQECHRHRTNTKQLRAQQHRRRHLLCRVFLSIWVRKETRFLHTPIASRCRAPNSTPPNRAGVSLGL